MLDQFMEKVSKEMELDEPLKAQVPNVYSIPLDEGLAVTITSKSTDQYEFTCVLGPCPRGEREAFFTRLLQANLFGHDTFGSVLGMDVEANQLTLTKNIDYHIDYKEFRDIVEDFFNAADYWRTRGRSTAGNL